MKVELGNPVTIEARHLAFGVKQSKEVEHVGEVHREGICQEVNKKLSHWRQKFKVQMIRVSEKRKTQVSMKYRMPNRTSSWQKRGTSTAHQG